MSEELTECLKGIDDVDTTTYKKCHDCGGYVVDDGWYSFATDEGGNQFYIKRCEKCQPTTNLIIEKE